MRESLVVQLAEKSTVDALMYADAPLKMGGNPKYISVSDLNKLVSQPFTYSNGIFSQNHQIDFSQLKKDRAKNDHISTLFEKIGLADHSQFVICKMGEVGHGLFANKDFEPGECFLLYSGVFATKATNTGTRPDYSLDFDASLHCCIDSSQYGNIARFIQHMPLNYNLSLQRKKCLPSSVARNLSPDSTEFWEWRNLYFKNGFDQNQVAWANMVSTSIEIDGVICALLYNTCKISKGDQLGLSYGIGYWFNRNLKPELFNLNGGILSASFYNYKAVMIGLPPCEAIKSSLDVFKQLTNRGVVTYYNGSMFQDDLNRKQNPLGPVYFHHLSEPVSLYDLRDLLLRFNVIDAEFQSIENQFLEELKSRLPDAFTTKIYVRNPANRHQKNIVDVVCKTNDLMKWAQLTIFLKNPKFVGIFNFQTKCFKFTQEVIFLDISDLETQNMLLAILEIANDVKMFSQDLKPDFIPKGPTHLDKTMLYKTTGEEEISQILRHNPTYTKESILRDYTIIDDIFKMVGSADKKMVTLDQLTMTFFKNKPKASWKVYPPNQLTGKYVGHNVRFFNIVKEDQTLTQAFFNKIVSAGFNANLIHQKDKNSIVVDLTESRLK